MHNHNMAPEWKAALKNALREAEPPVLLMCYAQMTGDADFVRAFKPYIRKVRDYADNIPEVMLEDLYQRLETLISARQNQTSAPLDLETLKELMDICVGEPVDQAYVPMLLEDMGYDTEDLMRQPETKTFEQTFPENFKIVIVGGGFGGICAAIYCKRAGLDFVLLEKNSAAGGTWWENIYPNCGVDAPNHLYSYSFNLKHDWSRYFVRQGEIQSYISACIDQFDLRDHIQFDTKVETATYNEDSEDWTITATGPKGDFSLRANSVIISCGQLNNPKVPDFKGKDSFEGPAFHTARWDNSVDLTGKRVALIGVGASSVQVGPGIVDRVGALTIYQRSAQWINQRANYDRVVTEGKCWALEHIPFYARWYRFQLLWAFSDAVYPALRVDPEWQSEDGRSINAFSQTMGQTMLSYMRKALEGRPDLIEKSTPDFPPYSKRPLFDNRWFETLKKDHVTLRRAGIAEITPDGILDDQGTFTPVDAIIYATGFHANKMIPSIEVKGRAGHSIRGDWGDDDPKAYLGVTVPNYPNMFLIYGPNTNYAHGGSIVFNIECQVRYIMKCLASLKSQDARSIEVTQEAFDAYNADIEARLDKMIWTQKGISTWYKNSRGRVITNTPYTMREYWEETHHLDGAHYLYRSRKTAAA